MNDALTSIPVLNASPISVVSGRVSTLSLGDDVVSVRIVDRPEHGNVTVNPDGTLALVLSETDYVGRESFSCEVTYNDGSVKTVTPQLNLVRGEQAAGWGLGDFMGLETDAHDRSIVEHGDNHRVVHVSGNAEALSLADIAAREGVPAAKITGAWLQAHPEYGSSPEMALDEKAGLLLWDHISAKQSSGKDAGASSNWLLFEKGYTYDITLKLTHVTGESALHPVLISSYGARGEAVLTGTIAANKSDVANIVIQDLNLDRAAFDILHGKNILLENINATRTEINLQNIDAATLRNSNFWDTYREASTRSGDGIWNPSQDRISALFVKNSDGLLIENNVFDHAGWGEGYDYAMSDKAPQAPSFYSHNIYIQKDNTDVTLRDTISMRAASFGAQVRSGGFVEDNVFLDNNAGVFTAGGNYTLFSGNLVTSGAYKEVAQKQGALSMGAGSYGSGATLIDSIVAHLADPNNAEEQVKKYIAHEALANKNTYYDNTIVYNWTGQKDIVYADKKGPRNPDLNTEGLDEGVLDQTTIQNFTAQLLGQKTATIADLADYLRAQAEGALDHVVDADLILAFFRKGFGLTPDLDTGAETQRFVPSDLGEGMRWDNRLNWDKGYLPTNGQNVDFGGNWIHYAGAGTKTVGDLDFGSGGRLTTTAGKLTIAGELSAGTWGSSFAIGNAGQVWIDGYADKDRLEVGLTGGRFANTGQVSGLIEMNISGGQALLAAGTALFDLGTGSRIKIVGDEAKLGFDGTAGTTGGLRLSAGSSLAFVANATGVSAISEFRSGSYGAGAPDMLTTVSLGGALAVDLTALRTGVTRLTLISADEISGDFGSVTVTGLGSGRNATLLVDYNADAVTLTITKGTGQTIRETSRNQDTLTDETPAHPAPLPPTMPLEPVPVKPENPVLNDPTPVKESVGVADKVVHQVLKDGREVTSSFQNGVLTNVVTVDVKDTRNWASLDESYDANGYLTKSIKIDDHNRSLTTWFADGVRQNAIWTDTDNNSNWTSQKFTYSAGGLSEQIIHYDDGRSIITQFESGKRTVVNGQDLNDVAKWDQYLSRYDTKGKLAENIQRFDDGREVEKIYANGKITSEIVLDLEDQFQWKSTMRTYAENGDMLTSFRVLDNKAVEMSRYTNGILHSTTMGEESNLKDWIKDNATYNTLTQIDNFDFSF